MDNTHRLSLPFPPSLNNAFVQVGRRRIKTKRYAKWRQDAAYMVLASKLPRQIATPVSIMILITPPNNYRRDIDNLVKPILDVLVETGRLPGDDSRYIHKVTSAWAKEPSKRFSRADVEITTLK